MTLQKQDYEFHRLVSEYACKAVNVASRFLKVESIKCLFEAFQKQLQYFITVQRFDTDVAKPLME